MRPAPPRLSIAFCESDTEAFLSVLGLARRAPIFESLETGAGRLYRATFADVTQSLGLVIQLVDEAIKCQSAQATINDQAVRSLTRFWSALICYQESLAEPKPRDHCLYHSARLSDYAGCPARSCMVPCQFICTRCLGLFREQGVPPSSSQLIAIAQQAEVEWCPNLRLPSPLG